MSVRDPFPTCFIVVGKEAIARVHTVCSIGNAGLQCIIHTVETNLKVRRYEDFPEAH
mgnify:CR=1 FL=1